MVNESALKVTKIVVFLAIGCLVTALVLFAFGVRAALDKPHLVPYVNDFANVISPNCETTLNDLAAMIEQNSTAEIAMVTMPTLAGENLEQYSNDLFRASGVGQREKNNGIMVIIFMQERKYRIEVGYGLEGTIPDTLAKNIAEEALVPDMKLNDTCSAFKKTLSVLGNEIMGESDNTAGKPINDNMIFWIIVLVIIIGVVVFLFILSGEGDDEGGGSGSGGYHGGGRGGSFGGGSSGGGGASGGF